MIHAGYIPYAYFPDKYPGEDYFQDALGHETVTVQSCEHVVSPGIPSLTRTRILTARDTNHSVQASKTTLTFAAGLKTQDANHSVQASKTTLTFAAGLKTQDANHLVRLEQLMWALFVVGASHVTQIDRPAVDVAVELLIVQGSSHSTQTDKTTLTFAAGLKTQDANHTVDSGRPDLYQVVITTAGVGGYLVDNYFQGIRYLYDDYFQDAQEADLIIQSPSHTVQAENITLELPSAQLVVQDTSHSQTATEDRRQHSMWVDAYGIISFIKDVSAAVITLQGYDPSIDVLTVQSPYHVVQSDDVDAVYSPAVFITQDGSHSVGDKCGQPSVTPGGLVVQDGLHEHDAVVLRTQNRIRLTVQDSSHLNSPDVITWVPGYGLEVQSGEHTVESERPDVSTSVLLTVQSGGSSHRTIVEYLYLGEEVIVRQTFHVHQAGRPDVALLLAVQDANHTVWQTRPHISPEELTVQPGNHTQQSTAIITTTHRTLVTPGVNHTHEITAPTITRVHTTLVRDAGHIHSGELLALVRNAPIIIQSTNHLTISDLLALYTNIELLEPKDARSSHAAENILFELVAQFVVQDSGHLVKSDFLTLGAVYPLIVQATYHSHQSDRALIFTALPIAALIFAARAPPYGFTARSLPHNFEASPVFYSIDAKKEAA